MVIYIIRHGESEANVKNMFPGLSYPLTKTGKEQINSLIPYLQNGGIIYSSPVLRARQSAEILGNALKLKVIVDKRLTEVGSRLDSDVKLKSLEEVKKYTGEPIAAMRRRMCSAINGISADNAIVVSHGHPIAAYLHRVVGSEAKHSTIDSLTPFKGSLSIVETKAPHIILFNWVPYALKSNNYLGSQAKNLGRVVAMNSGKH
ncbi:MAG: histidine phosphatase family protein [Nitrososphaerota archaeon]|nr:histidine phosphatase family protein [Nitrososphaerota archaeon]